MIPSYFKSDWPRPGSLNNSFKIRQLNLSSCTYDQIRSSVQLVILHARNEVELYTD